MRIGIAYDCCYPCTIGGAERWYRSLAEVLAACGHDVTYLTQMQWAVDNPPSMEGVEIVPLGGRNARGGQVSRLANALMFQHSLRRHLRNHPGEFEVVHTSCLPYLTLPRLSGAAAAADAQLVVDWWEVLSPEWWRSHAGLVAGSIGVRSQQRAAQTTHQPLVYSKLHASRLDLIGTERPPVQVEGIFEPSESGHVLECVDPVFVYAGRLIPDKQVEALVPALEVARTVYPQLRLRIIGEGPSAATLRRLAEGSPAKDAIEITGFVAEPELHETLRSSAGLLVPSAREGYGLIVLDAISRGTPAVVARGPESAATERIVPGLNGVISASAAPQDLAAAMMSVITGGAELRASTRAWWSAHQDFLCVSHGVRQIENVYSSLIGATR